MNKIFIKIILLFLIIPLASCSYSPIFADKNYDFEIKEIIFSGEKTVNKIINNKLKLIKSNVNLEKKKYNLNIYSEKKKNVLSKDSKGDPLKIEMIILVKYDVNEKGSTILSKKIEKNNIYNNKSDQFELERSEKIILENISNNISDIIISTIINLNDN